MRLPVTRGRLVVRGRARQLRSAVLNVVGAQRYDDLAQRTRWAEVAVGEHRELRPALESRIAELERLTADVVVRRSGSPRT